MATKTISIDVEAYERLRDRKKEGESFSQAIKRLVPRSFDYKKWLNELQANPLSSKAFAAIETVVAQRQSPQNMRGYHAVSGHHRADRSGIVKKTTTTAKSRGNGARSRAGR